MRTGGWLPAGKPTHPPPSVTLYYYYVCYMGVLKSTDPFGSVDLTFGGKSTDPSIWIGSVDLRFCGKSTDLDPG